MINSQLELKENAGKHWDVCAKTRQLLQAQGTMEEVKTRRGGGDSSARPRTTACASTGIGN